MEAARVALPGVALVATSFGLARYGYGLLVPDMRRSFGLDATTVGLLASGAYVAYLGATLSTISLVARRGPRSAAVLSGVLATVGMAIIATASSIPMLALGVVVAGASSGFAFPPFADLVADHVAPSGRGGALAAISSGTGWGVALAAPAAIAVGRDWRTAWLIFAAVALAVTAAVRLLLPDGRIAVQRSHATELRARWFISPPSRPLLLSAFLVGLSASVYWTFAPDAVQSAQGSTVARVLLVMVGISSIGGAFASRILRRLGPASGFRVCAALLSCSLALLMAGAGAGPIALASGLAFGVTYSLVVAVQVIWSDEVFASRPSAGLAATMVMFALGQILGPTVAGVISDRAGVSTTFGLAAGVMTLTLLMAPPSRLRSAPLTSGST